MARGAGRLAALVAAALLALACAGAARAARLVQIRIGAHVAYTRVVLETDAPAPYEILPTDPATPDAVTIRMAAANAVTSVPSGAAGAPEIVLASGPDDTTLVTIRSPRPARIETQMLTAPPRLVVDLRRSGPPPATVAAVAPPEPDLAEVPPSDAHEEALVMPAVEAPVEVAAPAAGHASGVDDAAKRVPAAPAVEVSDAEPETTPPGAAPAPGAETASPAESEVPPVSTAPPLVSPVPTSLVELRSLATGLSVGVAMILVSLSLLRRGARSTAPETGRAIGLAPPAFDVPSGLAVERARVAADLAEAERAAATQPERKLEEANLSDFVRMQGRVAERLDQVLARLDDISARIARLEARGGRQDEEILSQRAAIARLQRATRVASPPLRASEREEDAPARGRAS